MTGMVRNPFATAAGAARYRAGRPYHHPRALKRMFAVMGDDHLDKALDVACGTGLSTVALANHARLAVGVDSVQAMVQSALRASNTFYALATAEQLPFHANMFDLLTVSSGVHWFDQPTFFAVFRGAARCLVLGPSSSARSAP